MKYSITAVTALLLSCHFSQTPGGQSVDWSRKGDYLVFQELTSSYQYYVGFSNFDLLRPYFTLVYSDDTFRTITSVVLNPGMGDETSIANNVFNKKKFAETTNSLLSKYTISISYEKYITKSKEIAERKLREEKRLAFFKDVKIRPGFILIDVGQNQIDIAKHPTNQLPKFQKRYQKSSEPSHINYSLHEKLIVFKVDGNVTNQANFYWEHDNLWRWAEYANNPVLSLRGDITEELSSVSSSRNFVEDLPLWIEIVYSNFSGPISLDAFNSLIKPFEDKQKQAEEERKRIAETKADEEKARLELLAKERAETEAKQKAREEMLEIISGPNLSAILTTNFNGYFFSKLSGFSPLKREAYLGGDEAKKDREALRVLSERVRAHLDANPMTELLGSYGDYDLAKGGYYIKVASFDVWTLSGNAGTLAVPQEGTSVCFHNAIQKPWKDPSQIFVFPVKDFLGFSMKKTADDNQTWKLSRSLLDSGIQAAERRFAGLGLTLQGYYDMAVKEGKEQEANQVRTLLQFNRFKSGSPGIYSVAGGLFLKIDKAIAADKIEGKGAEVKVSFKIGDPTTAVGYLFSETSTTPVWVKSNAPAFMMKDAELIMGEYRMKLTP